MRSPRPNCFLIRATGWVERHGVTINLVMTDNGSGYRPLFFLIACHNLGAKPYTLRTTDKAERFIPIPAPEEGSISKFTIVLS
jgi:hypothetical protein